MSYYEQWAGREINDEVAKAAKAWYAVAMPIDPDDVPPETVALLQAIEKLIRFERTS